MDITVDGKTYTVEHFFSATRAIINFDGLYVLVDKYPDGTWELSGEPARENEKPILNALVAPMLDKSILKVIPPDEQ